MGKVIEEAFLTLEATKLLKEKGFVVDPAVEKTIGWKENIGIARMVEGKYWSTITQQKAMRWLREEHDIDIVIFHENLPDSVYWARIEKRLFTEMQQEPIYKTYEDSADAAILYCLENLV